MNRTNRRCFLRATLGAGAATLFTQFGSRPGRCAERAVNAPRKPRQRKLIVIVFGGGTRSSEAIDDPEHRYIPRLWNDMVPRGTLLTNMRVEGKVVHPRSTGSIMTGHWEYDDNDWTRPVVQPTIFEQYRREAGADDTKAWAFVYASILAQTGESLSPEHGERFAANVLTPPTIPRTTGDQIRATMQDAQQSGSHDRQVEAARACADLARQHALLAENGLRSEAARRFVAEEHRAWITERETTSHDHYLARRAIACMKHFSPDVISIAFGEIDCAHYGSWSRYVEAIRRTDHLTHAIWQTVQQLDAYRDNTTMLILPDHGRELDGPEGFGFIHHSDFYRDELADEACRHVWMLAVGPDIAAGRMVDDYAPITAAAATGLESLGLPASPGSAQSVMPLLA